MSDTPRILYACQRCGEEVGEREQDHRCRHQNCGGQLDPIGACEPDDAHIERMTRGHAPLTDEDRAIGLDSEERFRELSK
jgi:hypothetical protein